MAHIRVRATALILQDDSVLLIEYDDNGVHYNLPGGGAEPGETIRDAVRREAYEEACIDVEVGPLAFVYEFAPHRQSGDYEPTEKHSLHLIFDCTLRAGSAPRLPEKPDKHQSAVKWISVEALDAVMLMPNIKEHIQSYAKHRRSIDLIEDHTLPRLELPGG